MTTIFQELFWKKNSLLTLQLQHISQIDLINKCEMNWELRVTFSKDSRHNKSELISSVIK